MEDNELLNIWKSYDQKLEQVLSINKQLTYDLTKDKLNKTINRLKTPKRVMLFFGIPYTLLLIFITFIAFKAGSPFVFIGFGAISIIMTIVVILYFYHLVLINAINNNSNIIEVQEKISKLKVSSFNSTKLAIIQLPFWSICWVSLDAVKNAPFLYGGINFIVFLGLSYFTYWLYRNIDIQNMDSKINKFFFAGSEWDPIIKSTNILEQLKEYKSNENI